MTTTPTDYWDPADHVTQEAIFGFHPATTEARVECHQLIREGGMGLADRFLSLCPNSREKALALTKLQEACMWANAAVAIHYDEK